MANQHDPSDYQAKLVAESRKWGDHLQVEATGEWHAWLDHPLIAEHYHRRCQVDGVPWMDYVRRSLGGPASRSLDLGCGSGGRSFAVYDAGASAQLDGTDVSGDRIAEAERIRQARGIAGRFWEADVNTIELPEEHYDLIFSCHSFHHFLKLEAIMERVHRALTSRGLFVLEEYVGPTQFQWTDLQIDLVRSLLALLPEELRQFRRDSTETSVGRPRVVNLVRSLIALLPPELRRNRRGSTKTWEGRPRVDDVVAASPFESIRSAEIVPLFRDVFSIVAMAPLGGTLQHLLYNGIIHNFDPSTSTAHDSITAIYAIEDKLVDSGLLPSDFMLMIGQKR